VITGGSAVLTRANVAPASTVSVLGVGGVGMSVIQGARIAGARQIIAVDVVDYKLVRAREFGATEVVNATKVDPVDTVRRMSGGGVDYAFEAIGFGETARQAFEMLRDDGWATMLGVAPANSTVEVPAAALRREKVLTGRHGGRTGSRSSPVGISESCTTVAPMPDEMITKRFPPRPADVRPPGVMRRARSSVPCLGVRSD
jgi:S-(hydroxymethyl)glutathione dehydrogenase/alcohol dehydrogenase